MNGDQKNKAPFTVEDLQQYLQGTLAGEKMHAIEKAALDDPFLADAIEGMRELKERSGLRAMGDDIHELQNRLQKRVSPQRWVIPLGNNSTWWRIAAVVFVFAVGLTLYNYITRTGKKEVVAKTCDRGTQVEPASRPAAVPDSRLDARTSDSQARNSSQNLPGAGPPVKQSLKKAAAQAVKSDNRGASTVQDSGAISSVAAASAIPVPPADKSRQGDLKAKRSVLSGNDKPEVSPIRGNYFSGTVLNEKNQPLAGVTISLPDQTVAATTDKAGKFRLAFSSQDSPVIARIHSAGYEPEFVTLSDEVVNSHQIVTLHESREVLSEVAPSGYAARIRRKPDWVDSVASSNPDAEPASGWLSYRQYLETNSKSYADSLGQHGEVLVSFDLNRKGIMSGFRIVKSLGPEPDQKAIRLILQGPSWKLLRGKHSVVSVRVTF